MTLFSPRYMRMSGELKSSRSRATSKRASNTTYGACDYQRVPASISPLPLGPSGAKRSRYSSHSYSSRHRRSRDRTHSKSSKAQSTSSNTAKLGMEELQVIKKELTLIKTQIDGLLESLDRMDTQRDDQKDSPLREDSPLSLSYDVTASSPEHSLSSLSPPSSHHRIRESPDMKMSSHSFDPEEEI
ncbi:heterogeneous nuclear ribonucleoprotein C-like isoform X2 [Cyprinodon tularosa]|uniref:heterogeneous nuclear ribonucleoprotein C-like isoform X2 n=1 Tax=Cyprinodon tularosa TaxID=77115 RepID=UPI0018E248A2|nr:heterogeneous nuclear ribonucleoprotein C-like isoform X2 [Cyprinodon tularosa]